MLLWMLRTLHHWLGAVFAAFFFVIAVSGVWLTLATTLGETLSNSAFRDSPKHFTAIEASEPVAAITAAYGVETIEAIAFPVRGRAAFLVERAEGADVYLDQQTLSRIAHKDQGVVTRFMYRLHVELLGLFGAGKAFVVATGLAVAYLTLNGLIVFFPLRRSFDAKSILGPKSLSFTAMRRAHISTGLVFSGFVFLFGVTGWVIGDRAGADQVFRSFDSAEQRPEVLSGMSETTNLRDLIRPDLSRVSRAELQPNEAGADVLLFVAQRGDLFPAGHTRLRYDLVTQDIAEVCCEAEPGLATKFADNSLSLHGGGGMGWPYQVLLSVVGLFSASLSVWALATYALRWRRRWGVFNRRRKTEGRP